MNLRTRLGSLAIGVVTCAALAAFPARAEIDRDTMVGLWLFDENGGAITQDRSDGGHDGILKRAPVWTDGRYGSGMDFQVGKGSYVKIDESAADVPFGGTDPFTITAWINPRTGGVVVSKFNGGVIGAYILRIDAAGGVTFHREVAPWGLASAGRAPDGEFWHVAATYDGSDMRILVDGVQVAEEPRGAQNLDEVTAVLIGASFSGNIPGGFFDGLIDEVAIFNVALSEDDVQEVMRGLAGPEAVSPAGKAAVAWGRLRAKR